LSHLLDTNTVVDLFRRGPTSKVTTRLIAAPSGSVFVCSVVVGELVYGAYHSGPSHVASNLALIADLQKQFVSLPFNDRAAEEYGKLRDHLGRIGQLIGPNDL
jgi:tRNA(fMet)-specific endonuclease VapC